MNNNEKPKHEQLKTEVRQKSNSIGSLDDYIKRRRPREVENSSTVFKRSKRTERTPTRENKYIAAELEVIDLKNMDEIKRFMETISSDIKQMREENSEIKHEIRENNKKMQKQIETQTEELKIMREELNQVKTRWNQEKISSEKKIDELKNKLETVNFKIELQEREKRRNKLLVTGLKIEEMGKSTIEEKIEGFLRQTLDVEVTIRTAYKIGEEKCVIEVESWEKKLEIMRNKFKLNRLTSERVYIDHDLTVMERGIQAKIREQAGEMRKSGKRVKVGYQKLICDSKLLKWKREDGCLQEVPKN